MNPQPRFLVLLFIQLFAGGVFAQQGKPLKVDLDLVMATVSVTDDENRPVTDLKSEHFQIFEDKIAQSVKYFSTEVAPISLGIVFDVSHSMQKKIDVAREAAATFL